MEDNQKPPVQLEYVLDKEQTQIEKVRKIRDKGFDAGDKRTPKAKPAPPIAGKAPSEKPKWQKEATDWVRVIKNAHKMNLVGLAFSGGGIRSASFNLGVLQALADLKLLCRIDYLSTVSGGGYIGSWLAAWTKRVKSFATVQENISTHRVNLEDDKEQPPVRFLRVFSNYLTPNLGIFSGDTWAMIAIYIRNLLLNLTIILALVATFLLLPRAVKMLAREALSLNWIGYGLMIAEAGLLLVAFIMILINLGYLDSRQVERTPRTTEQKWILLLVSAPLYAAAVAAASWLTNHQLPPYGYSVSIGAIAYCGIWGLASLGGIIFGKRIEETATSPRPHDSWEKTIKIGATLGAGALAGWLFALLSLFPAIWHDPENVMPLTVGVPLVAGVFLLTVVLHIGLMGTVFRDWKREWWGRLGGWLLIFSITWLMLFWVALCFPDFIRSHPELWTGWKAWAMKSLTPAWILSTIGTVMAGNSKDTSKPGTTSWLDVAIKFGPYVFMAGLLCWVSYGMDCLLATYSGWWPKMLFAAAVMVVLVIMAWRVDINQFSMHMFYRNRLVSCFLGASRVGLPNEERSPNRFTGFDPGDDMPLKDLRWNARNQCGKRDPYDGPYPILNASLNLVKGKDLAWQERKAESFVMTPHYCGYDVWLEEQDSPMLVSDRGSSKELERYGYRPTVEYAFPIPQYHGPNLGLAMAISGAAASPNMGYHSSAPVAFLMTVFNVRLGQWLGNPRNRETSRRATPRMGLWCLMNELFGGTNDDAAYVYLSDGGHFDNMGLYELVKRRCGLIILCDAEADEKYTFLGLGNAIRKCRIDLGIDVDLDTSAIVPDKTSGLSKQHYAVGTIHYEYADINAPAGTIIYFKASLTGNESSDVKNYTKAHDAFPHESTVNQWFSESQFESYRQLGYETVSAAIRNTPPVPLKPKGKTLRAHFKEFGAKINI
jgi:hypothetical protein